jgi:hypothetical protein
MPLMCFRIVWERMSSLVVIGFSYIASDLGSSADRAIAAKVSIIKFM